MFINATAPLAAPTSPIQNTTEICLPILHFQKIMEGVVGQWAFGVSFVAPKRVPTYYHWWCFTTAELWERLVIWVSNNEELALKLIAATTVIAIFMVALFPLVISVVTVAVWTWQGMLWLLGFGAPGERQGSPTSLTQSIHYHGVVPGGSAFAFATSITMQPVQTVGVGMIPTPFGALLAIILLGIYAWRVQIILGLNFF